MKEQFAAGFCSLCELPPNKRLQLTERMQGGSRAVCSALGLRGCRRTPRSRSASR